MLPQNNIAGTLFLRTRPSARSAANRIKNDMQQDLATIDSATAEQIVHSINIPSCPAILTTLVREMRSDAPDFARVGRLIGSDVGLAASVLKTVNSPFYGLPNKATSVRQALALLGLRTVSQLVTGLLLREAFPVADSRFMERFWDLSSHVALIAAHLAARLGNVHRDDAYTFGLFRDCGMPLLLMQFTDYSRVCATAQMQSEPSMTAIEDEHFDINHAYVGNYLATSWHLSDTLCLAILRHHDHADPGDGAELPAASRQLIMLGMAAEHVLRTYRGEPATAEWQRWATLALVQLDLSEDEFAGLGEEAHQMLARD